MTQWLLEKNLVALNTMYKKIPQKHVSYHTQKGAKKQLDCILTDKKHYCWSKDAEANDVIHMGSDHRCVMAKFEIPEKAKKKSRRNKAPSVEIEGDTKKKEELTDQTREDGLEPIYKDLEQEVKDAEPEKVQKTATKKAAVTEAATAALQAATDGDAITKNNAEAAEATEASEAQETRDKDQEILALIQERKMTEKHEKERIREISKQIKKCIREKERTTRQEKYRRSWKNPKEQRTSPISSL